MTAERHRGEDEPGACHEPEGEEQHQGADPVSRQDATRGRKPEDDQPVHGGQHGNDQVLSIERVRPARKQEGGRVQDRHRRTHRDRATEGDRCARRDDDRGQQPHDRRSAGGDAEPGPALRASLALVEPFHPIVEEPQRASSESPAIAIELGRRSIGRLGRPARSGRLAAIGTSDVPGPEPDRNGHLFHAFIDLEARACAYPREWAACKSGSSPGKPGGDRSETAPRALLLRVRRPPGGP